MTPTREMSQLKNLAIEAFAELRKWCDGKENNRAVIEDLALTLKINFLDKLPREKVNKWKHVCQKCCHTNIGNQRWATGFRFCSQCQDERERLERIASKPVCLTKGCGRKLATKNGEIVSGKLHCVLCRERMKRKRHELFQKKSA